MIGIIGAGPSGLAVSLFLTEAHEVLEQTDQVGGHASSFFEQGFTFDYGPHILFSRDKEILDFIVTSLGDNVNRCRRNNKIAFKDRLVKYPFENDLHSLPLDDNYACIHNFIFNPYKTQYASPANMREWFLKTFGEGLCSRYLFPYNEKVWNIPIEQLSMDLAERIPNPAPEDILKSSLGYNTEGYRHQLYYYYPKTGGYQAICQAWEKAVPLTRTFRVNKIEKTADQRLRVRDDLGQSRDYHHIISTMPVHELIHCLDWEVPQAIHAAVEQLIVNPMMIISFGIRGVDRNQYTAVYFPEAEFWVNRISYPCTFSSQNGPEGCWSIQAEITCARGSELWYRSDEEILQHTRQGLQQRQLLPSDEDILFERIDRQEKSYVVYKHGYEEHAQEVRQWFQSQGISLLGRFSRFEYINIDMAVERALQLATELNGDPPQKSLYLARALQRLA
ncbi:protoporphyrinogen/coproporphyrinogen oxidase [Legionella sp. CNM-4043-24]|uniref:protoporphyrinogen/coproporphyrinogen oxidase n=1 Tax=Legionella sp. CNM-4043-24 TaxID=3421646 RepID=UPI00403B166C